MQTTETEHLGAAWEEIRPELSRLVRALGIGSASADDILQEVFLTAREKCPAALSPDDLRRWMIRVTVNRCRLEHRRSGRWRRAFEKLSHFFDRRQIPSAAESLDRDEARRLVRQSLELLPAETRTLLVLRYFAELNSTEIGKIFDLPEATVRGRLSAARHKLAETLRRKGYRPDE
ncbi:MAG: RNA polymerase sigma factor [Pirellulales bacterium]|nr:RNA polymerase sigma factor [Pirellulales bacterium]